MVWEYLGIIKRLAKTIQDSSDEKEMRQDVCVTIILAVTAAETFLNLFFQIATKKPEFAEHQQYILKSLNNRLSLEKKVKNWTMTVFNKPIDVTQGIGKNFDDLRQLRNSLMHFNSNETVRVDNVELHNWSDVTVYETLVGIQANDALVAVLELIQKVLELSGLIGPRLKSEMLRWTGFPDVAMAHLIYWSTLDTTYAPASPTTGPG